MSDYDDGFEKIYQTKEEFGKFFQTHHHNLTFLITNFKNVRL